MRAIGVARAVRYIAVNLLASPEGMWNMRAGRVDYRRAQKDFRVASFVDGQMQANHLPEGMRNQNAQYLRTAMRQMRSAGSRARYTSGKINEDIQLGLDRGMQLGSRV